LRFSLSFVSQCYECEAVQEVHLHSISYIEKMKVDDLHTEAMARPPRLTIYTVVGKETGQKEGQLHAM